eukprot:jgi/Psemu1/43925/gm1.43925_g
MFSAEPCRSSARSRLRFPRSDPAIQQQPCGRAIKQAVDRIPPGRSRPFVRHQQHRHQQHEKLERQRNAPAACAKGGRQSVEQRVVRLENRLVDREIYRPEDEKDAEQHKTSVLRPSPADCQMPLVGRFAAPVHCRRHPSKPACDYRCSHVIQLVRRASPPQLIGVRRKPGDGTMNKTLATLAAAGLALTATAAQAENVNVTYSDLNLNTVAGQKELSQRIDRVAREVCGYGAARTGTRLPDRAARECHGG